MQVTEQELADKAVAPRVTQEAVLANIAHEFYFTAADGVVGCPTSPLRTHESVFRQLDLLTFCVLILKNGFTVTGESACASPENFDPDVGRRLARQQAINKIWPLMGYELRSKLAEEEAINEARKAIEEDRA